MKSTAAEIASVARAPPEERPALVAEICKPKPPKPPAQKQKAPPAVAAPLPNASTSEEECTDEELVHTPAPQEQTFPQGANEPLKIDRQQILEIANSRYVQTTCRWDCDALRGIGSRQQYDAPLGKCFPGISRYSVRCREPCIRRANDSEAERLPENLEDKMEELL